VQLPPAAIVGAAVLHGLDPPFILRLKGAEDVIADTLSAPVPLLFILTSKGAGVLPVVTVPKLKDVGKTCIDGVVVGGGVGGVVPPPPLVPPPPPPQPMNANAIINAPTNPNTRPFLFAMTNFLPDCSFLMLVSVSEYLNERTASPLKRMIYTANVCFLAGRPCAMRRLC
jgi:hypothetical protein